MLKINTEPLPSTEEELHDGYLYNGESDKSFSLDSKADTVEILNHNYHWSGRGDFWYYVKNDTEAVVCEIMKRALGGGFYVMSPISESFISLEAAKQKVEKRFGL